MAYTIRKIKGIEISKLRSEILQTLMKSRFTCAVEITAKQIKLGGKGRDGVRLKESKPNCGNHAGPCLLGGPDRVSKCLEGADWIAFNDMVNDVLDAHKVEANVASPVCVTRKGKARRTYYGSFGHGDWLKDETNYTDNLGKGPIKSGYPSGTPGNSSYEVNN